MINKVLNSKTKTITFAALLVAGFSFFSRVLGLVRNNLLGNMFPSAEADIYLAAFRIPDFVYCILVTGGITAAFLPVFSKYFRKDQEKAKELSKNVLLVFSLLLSALSFILFIFAGSLVNIIVPGFSQYQKDLTVYLMRIMFLSPIILGISAIFSSVLQYFNLFFAYSIAPVFYNLGIIFGILFLSPKYGLAGLAYGVVIGALMHLLVQTSPAIKYFFAKSSRISLKHPGLLRIFKLMVPRTIGAAGMHINMIVITAIASTLSTGAIRTFVFSNDLYGVPLGLIGVSFAAAAFPALSRSFTEKNNKEFSWNFSHTFSEVLFLVIPLTFAMFLLRAHVVRLLYGTLIVGEGYFGWADTRLTAACVGVFSISILTGCLIPLLARTFYASHDTRTPVKVALFTVVLNILLALWFVQLLQTNLLFQQITTRILRLNGIANIAVVGLPLALSISSIIQCILLLIFLRRKMKFLSFKFIYNLFVKILPISIVMSVLMYGSLQVGSYLFDTHTVIGLFWQIVLACIVGIISYIGISVLFKLQELKYIVFSIRKQFRKQ